MSGPGIKIICLWVATSILMIFNSGVMAVDVVSAQPQNVESGVINKIWYLRLPDSGNDKVIYKGVASFDGAGSGTGTMVYPGVDPISFLAAVVAHGFIANSMKSHQKDKLQEAADQVLMPYQSVLNTYLQRELMQRGLEIVSKIESKKLVEFSEKIEGGWLIESYPMFSITQDQSAIIVDNILLIYPSGSKSATAYKNTVRVVSSAKEAADFTAYWTANQGEKLKEESASLFAQSLDVALTEVINGSKNTEAYKTIRYMEGNVEKMERGQVVSLHCQREIIKTLRGGLMSVPLKRETAPNPAAEQCL